MKKAYDFEPRRVANVERWESPYKALPSQEDRRKIAELEAIRIQNGLANAATKPPTFRFVWLNRTEAAIVAVVAVLCIAIVAWVAVSL